MLRGDFARHFVSKLSILMTCRILFPYEAIIWLVLAGAIVFMGYQLFIAESAPQALVDSEFGESVTYSCEGDQTLIAEFGEQLARVTFMDGRVFTLEQKSVSDEDGTKFSNEGDQIEFWVRDLSSFVIEEGTEIYSACRTI
jgi:hypothetical protein